jgi:hypothetical protein
MDLRSVQKPLKDTYRNDPHCGGGDSVVPGNPGIVGLCYFYKVN